METVSPKKSKENLSIVEQLKKEGIEPPEIQLDLFFIKHSTKEDAQKILNKLNGYDVLALEFIGWNEDIKNYINNISENNYKTYGNYVVKEIPYSNFPDFYETLIDGIASSKKKVVFPDIQKNSILDLEFNNLYINTDLYPKKSLSFEENATQFVKFLKKFIEFQTKRETEIVNNMGNEIIGLLKENPELQKKKQLKILFAVGAAHTSIHRHFKKNFWSNVTLSFAETKFEYPLLTSLLKTALHNEPAVVDKYAPQSYIVYMLLIHLGVDPESISLESINSFSVDQSHELFQCFINSKSTEDFQDLVKNSAILVNNKNIALAFGLK